MWVDPNLCPSAMSIWAFNHQKPWVENGGLLCDYIERMWGQDDIEEKCRLKAIDMIKSSINKEIPAISWDIGLPEWGLITGYNDQTQKLTTLSITGKEEVMDYTKLGKNEVSILSVLTIIGKTNKSIEDIISDSLKLAKIHLIGKEWSENPKGISAYPALIKHFEDRVLFSNLCCIKMVCIKIFR